MDYLDPNFAIFGKLALAAFLGLALGFERTIAGKLAGMRTYALMSLGSCLLIVIGLQVDAQYLGHTNLDPMRLAAGIITGVGFICGGLVVFTEQKLIGLTTSAGMWISVGVGIAVGFGLYTIATFAVILTIIIFSLLWQVEDYVRKVSGEKPRD